MDLLLQRSETPAVFGTRYNLFAKLELEPQELSHIRKTRPEKYIVMEDDRAKGQARWRFCLIPGGIAAVIVGVIAVFVFHPLLFLPVAAVAWIPLTKLFYNQVRQFVTVADLITGRTIHCKSLDELYMKEHEISEKIKTHWNFLKGMADLGSEQRTP